MAWFVSRRNCPSFLTANTVAGPLDRAHRSGRATGNHQDPPTTLLLYRRTAHFASAPALALRKPVQLRPGTIARAATPILTAPWAACPHPPHCPTAWQLRVRSGSGRLCRLLPRPSRPALPLRTVNIPLAWLPHRAPSRIGADQGHAVSVRCLSSPASSVWPHLFGGFGLRKRRAATQSSDYHGLTLNGFPRSNPRRGESLAQGRQTIHSS